MKSIWAKIVSAPLARISRTLALVEGNDAGTQAGLTAPAYYASEIRICQLIEFSSPMSYRLIISLTSGRSSSGGDHFADVNKMVMEP